MKERYSREWWAERLHLIKAFVDGKDVRVRNFSRSRSKEVSFSLPPEEYEISVKRMSGWVNTFRGPNGKEWNSVLFATREEADISAKKVRHFTRVACSYVAEMCREVGTDAEWDPRDNPNYR